MVRYIKDRDDDDNCERRHKRNDDFERRHEKKRDDDCGCRYDKKRDDDFERRHEKKSDDDCGCRHEKKRDDDFERRHEKERDDDWGCRHDKKRDDDDDIESEIERLREQISKLKRLIREQGAINRDLQRQINELNVKIDRINSELQRQINDINGRIDRLQAQIDDLKEEVAALRRQLNNPSRAQFDLGPPVPIEGTFTFVPDPDVQDGTGNITFDSGNSQVISIRDPGTYEIQYHFSLSSSDPIPHFITIVPTLQRDGGTEVTLRRLETTGVLLPLPNTRAQNGTSVLVNITGPSRLRLRIDPHPPEISLTIHNGSVINIKKINPLNIP